MSRGNKLLSGSAPWCLSFWRSAASGSAARTPPRWYKEVTVIPNAVEGEFLVQLDRRTLRTPARQLLALPSYPLALAVAAEWQRQENRIQPFTMPLMSLAATAIDIPKPKEAVIDTLLRFIHTDALMCRHDRAAVASRQAALFDPILALASKDLQLHFSSSDSIFGAQQSEETCKALKSYLEGLDNWQLSAVDSLCGTCKSVLLGVAVFKGWVGVQAAIDLARLEENLQLEEWGYVEGGHDIDDVDIKVRMASASVFARLLAPKPAALEG